MFRKTLISAITVAILATSGFSASLTSASATDMGFEVTPVSGKHDRKVAAGVAFGAAALILGAIAYSNQNDGYQGHKQNRKQRRHHDDNGYGAVECFDKKVYKYDAYRGRKVFVGYKTVCR